MLASLETPLLREDTAAAVAIVVLHLLMQTGEPLYSLSVTCGWGLGTFRGSVPSQRLGTCGAVLSATRTHTHRDGGARVLSRSARCQVTCLLDGQFSQLTVARWAVLLRDWLAE